MNIAKFLRTTILKNIHERLLLIPPIMESGCALDLVKKIKGKERKNLKFSKLDVRTIFEKNTRN